MLNLYINLYSAIKNMIQINNIRFDIYDKYSEAQKHVKIIEKHTSKNRKQQIKHAKRICFPSGLMYSFISCPFKK